MPGLREQRTGAEAIDQVRKLLGASVPALLITGDTAPERLREALGAGLPLLHKPLLPNDLRQALVALLATANSQEKREQGAKPQTVLV